MKETPEETNIVGVAELALARWHRAQLSYFSAYNVYIKADNTAIEAYNKRQDPNTLLTYKDAKLLAEKANARVDEAQVALEVAYLVVHQAKESNVKNKVGVWYDPILLC